MLLFMFTKLTLKLRIHGRKYPEYSANGVGRQLKDYKLLTGEVSHEGAEPTES
jgi:hypothetical protein